MSFEQRTGDAQRMVEVAKEDLWSVPAVRNRLIHVAYGAENIVPTEASSLLRYVRTPTTLHIRFAPDFFVADRDDPARTYLLEYKCTRSPLRYQGRINEIRRTTGNPAIGTADIGQWEASAYDNYRALAKLGIRVAVLNYCAYHPRPLLCEFVDRVAAIHRNVPRPTDRKGSGTPFVNIDLNHLRSFETFLAEEHGLELAVTAPLVGRVATRLLAELPSH